MPLRTKILKHLTKLVLLVLFTAVTVVVQAQLIEPSVLSKAKNYIAANDSLKKLVTIQAKSIKNLSLQTARSVAEDVWHTTKKLLKNQIATSKHAMDITELDTPLSGLLQKNFVEFTGGSIAMMGATYPLQNAAGIATCSSVANSNWNIMCIPIGLQLLHRDFGMQTNSSANAVVLQFDREAWLQSLRNKIKIKLALTELMPTYLQQLDEMKLIALNRIQLYLDSIKLVYAQALDTAIHEQGIKIAAVKTKIFGQHNLWSATMAKKIVLQQALLQQFKTQLNGGIHIDVKSSDSLLKTIPEMQEIYAMINKVARITDRLRIIALQAPSAGQLKDNLQECLMRPDQLTTMAEEQLGIRGIQKLFLHVNQLALGANTISLSPLSVYQYSNNGFHASFIKKQHFLFVMAGVQKEQNSLVYNKPAFSFSFPGQTAMGIRFGKGDPLNNHVHLSLFNYRQNKTAVNNAVAGVLPGHTTVATFSNLVKLNETNYLELELSKSSHQYTHQQNIYDSLQFGNRATQSATKNFVQQLAFSCRWNGEWQQRQMIWDLHGTYTGLAYNNPGNPFLLKGTVDLGGHLRKNLLHRQLQMAVKGNYRRYQYPESNTKWLSYNFYVQAGWKFKKGQYISLSYQPCLSIRWKENIKNDIAINNRLSVGGNFVKRFGSVVYQHSVGFSLLQNRYNAGNSIARTTGILVNTAQTAVINNKAYYFNLQYCQTGYSLQQLTYQSQFNVAAGCTYILYKSVTASSGIHYNNTRQWYRQLGFQQTLTAHAGDRLMVNIYASIEKKLHGYYPSNLNSSRIEWSCQYRLKNSNEK